MKKILLFIFLLTAYGLGLTASSAFAVSNNGLVGYWPFDDATGTQAGDSSGNGKHGTLVNMEESDWVAGKFDRAVSFGGTDEIITLPEVETISDTRTICLWFKLPAQFDATSATSYPLYVKAESDLNHFNIVLHGQDYDIGGGAANDGKITAKLDDGSGASYLHSTTATWEADRWYFITLVMREGRQALYVNAGSEAATAHNRGISAYDAIETIGGGDVELTANVMTTNYSVATIDEVRVYTRELTDPEIQKLYEETRAILSASQNEFITDGLILNHTFDGPQIDWSNGSAEARDVSTGGNHGDVIGAIALRGKIGQALQFDGVDDHVNVGDITDADEFSVSFWMKPLITYDGTLVPVKSICGKYLNGNNGFGFSFVGTDFTGRTTGSILLKFEVGGIGSRFEMETTTTTWTANEWYYVTYVHEATLAASKIYVNAIDETSVFAHDGAHPALTFSADFKIGGVEHEWTADAFTGAQTVIDEFRVYDRALSVSEIEQLYNLGGGGGLGTGSATIGYPHGDILKDGLAFYQSFDGPNMDWANATGEAREASGSANHGNAVNDVATSRGKIGQALKFDGVDDYVVMTADLKQAPLSYAVWVKPDQNISTDLAHIVGHLPHTVTLHYGYGIAYNNGEIICYACNNNNSFTSNLHYPITAGEWTHVVFALESFGGISTGRLYMNGVLVDSYTGNANFYFQHTLAVGAGYTNAGNVGNYFNGLIDEVRIYNRVLSAEEIDQLHTLGRGSG